MIIGIILHRALSSFNGRRLGSHEFQTVQLCNSGIMSRWVLYGPLYGNVQAGSFSHKLLGIYHCKVVVMGPIMG